MAFQVVSNTPAAEVDANITQLDNGKLVVTWVDTTYDTVAARIFNADGTPDGNEFQVNQFAAAAIRDSEVVATPNGGFTILWRASNQDPTTGPFHSDLIARSYDANGTPTTNDTIIPLNTAGNGGTTDHVDTNALVLDDGTIMVSYLASNGLGGDGADMRTVVLNQDLTVHENSGTVFTLSSYSGAFQHGETQNGSQSVETTNGRVIHVGTMEGAGGGHAAGLEPVVFITNASDGSIVGAPIFVANGVVPAGAAEIISLGVAFDESTNSYAVFSGALAAGTGAGQIYRTNFDADGNITGSSLVGTLPSGGVLTGLIETNGNVTIDSSGNVIFVGGSNPTSGGAGHLYSTVFFADGTTPPQTTIHESNYAPGVAASTKGGSEMTWLDNGQLAVLSVQSNSVGNILSVITVPNTTGPPGGTPPDGIVSGTANNDNIVFGYAGDPDGDTVDAGDAVGNHFGAADGSDDDYIQAGAGDDNVEAGAGDDHVEAGTGNDTVDGGAGADNIDGEAGDDTLSGGGGGDTIIGGTGDDTIDGEGGGDTLTGGDGDDRFLISGGFGQDTITGGEAAEDNGGDVLDASGSNDDLTLDLRSDGTGINTSGAADGESGVLYRGGGGTHRAEFTEIESYQLGSGNDTAIGSDQADTIHTGDGNNTVNAGGGNDSITTGSGVDTVDLGDGDDTVTVIGGANVLTGGAGTDTLAVDAGATGPIVVSVDNDGTGTAALDGATSTLSGMETFTGRDTGDTDSITLETTVTDRSTISGIDQTAAIGTYTPTSGGPAIAFGGAGEPTLESILNDNTSAGTISITGGDESGTIGDISFSEMETINFTTSAVCFTPEGIIETAQGLKRIRDLAVGDKVLTRDNGYQELRWIYKGLVPQERLRAKRDLTPVVVKKDTFGPNVPDRDMTVSPGHMLLVSGDVPREMFGETEVLVPAKRLVNVEGVYRKQSAQLADGVVYVHLVFDAHEVVRVDGMWSESFRPSPASLKMIHREGYNELRSIFPELNVRTANTLFPEVRPSLYAGKANRIVGRMAAERARWGN